jgi:hypothetical protein
MHRLKVVAEVAQQGRKPKRKIFVQLDFHRT